MTTLRVALLIIDPQNDFHPGGSLAVGGSDKDAERIAQLIDALGGKLTNIFITLDSHHKTHVAHSIVWVNQAGEHPAPFTLISADEIKAGVWKAADSKRQRLVAKYAQDLEAKGRFKLIIWPDHCIIASAGHNVTPLIHGASQRWVEKTAKQVHYVQKGQNVNTEMYSALQAEVPDEFDKDTSLNRKLMDQLRSFDKVVVCGQALSHCVNFTVRDIVDNWNRDNSDIIILTDAASPVGGFEAAGEEFLQFCRDNELTLHTCDSFSAAFETFAPSANKGPLHPPANYNLAANGLALNNEKLVAAVNNRRAAERELNRLMSKRVSKPWFVESLKSDVAAVAALNRVSAGVVATVEEAVLGANGAANAIVNVVGGADGSSPFNVDELRFVVNDEKGVVRDDSTGRYSSLSEEQGLAIRLFTYASHKISFAAVLSRPFATEGNVGVEDVANIAPFMGVLGDALKAYSDTGAGGFFRGTAYRGGKFSESAKMKALRDQLVGNNNSDDSNSSSAANGNYNEFAVGNTVVVPSFSSVYTSAADSTEQYGGDFTFVFNFNHDYGVDVSKISYFEKAGEIVLLPPAAFTVAAVEMVETKLVITLNSAEIDVTYV